MRIWTEEAKAAQREAIKRWQPWKRSTGPKTASGKQRAAVNARKTDRPSIKSIRVLRAALQAHSRCRRAVGHYVCWRNEKKSENRTIMMLYLKSLIRSLHYAFLKGILDWQRLDEEEDEGDKLIMSQRMKMAA